MLSQQSGPCTRTSFVWDGDPLDSVSLGNNLHGHMHSRPKPRHAPLYLSGILFRVTGKFLKSFPGGVLAHQQGRMFGPGKGRNRGKTLQGLEGNFVHESEIDHRIVLDRCQRISVGIRCGHQSPRDGAAPAPSVFNDNGLFQRLGSPDYSARVMMSVSPPASIPTKMVMFLSGNSDRAVPVKTKAAMMTEQNKNIVDFPFPAFCLLMISPLSIFGERTPCGGHPCPRQRPAMNPFVLEIAHRLLLTLKGPTYGNASRT